MAIPNRWKREYGERKKYLERTKKQNHNSARFEERLKNHDEELHKKTINGLKKIGDLE